MTTVSGASSGQSLLVRRVSLDTGGGICLTVPGRADSEVSAHQIDERPQILDPERAPPNGHLDEGIRIRRIRPSPGQRLLRAILPEEEHAVLTPRVPQRHEHELTTAPRMERMSHSNNMLPTGGIRRS
jgi:hypothetical protein